MNGCIKSNKTLWNHSLCALGGLFKQQFLQKVQDLSGASLRRLFRKPIPFEGCDASEMGLGTYWWGLRFSSKCPSEVLELRKGAPSDVIPSVALQDSRWQYISTGRHLEPIARNNHFHWTVQYTTPLGRQTLLKEIRDASDDPPYWEEVMQDWMKKNK